MSAALDAAGRRDLCLLIARLFREEVDAPLYRRLVALRGDGLEWIEPEVAALPEEQALEQLGTDYCRLFVGPDPVCPPFASVALGEALLGGRARTAIEEHLASRGLTIDEHARIASPDHIAVLFAALAELSDPEAAHDFLRRFMWPWVPAWLSVLQREAERLLFRTLASVAAAFLDEEQESSEAPGRGARR